MQLEDVIRVGQLIYDFSEEIGIKENKDKMEKDLKKAKKELEKVLVHRDHVKARIVEIERQMEEIEDKWSKKLAAIKDEINVKMRELHRLEDDINESKLILKELNNYEKEQIIGHWDEKDLVP